MASLNVLLLTATAAGASTHLGYFIKGEHHLYGVRYIQTLCLFFVIAVALDVRLFQKAVSTALAEASQLIICFLGGLYSSLLIYRAFFHPLNQFPGPWGNKLGNLWFSAQLGKADAYKKMLALHAEYGPFVRVGSSDLSIIHPNAVNVIYGMGTKCDRATFYNGDPLPSMISCRDRTAHDKRRRIWSPAFSDKALRGYVESVRTYDELLLSRIESVSAANLSMNVSKYFNYYSFDVMGHLAFGESFEMLKNDKEHWAIELMNTGLEALAFLFPTWLFRVLIAIPGLLRDHARITEFCNNQLAKRMTV
jgi:tryprostatin B 6-hydroxylase